MSAYSGAYVLFAEPKPVNCDGGFDSSPLFDQVYSQGEIRIWQVVGG